MLGGKVIHGDGIGKALGYPTANLDIAKNKCKLSTGVYAAKAFLHKKEYQSALAVAKKSSKVEVYLLNYKGGDFYDSFLEVDPIQKVSEMEKFDDEKELLEKIKQDMFKVKELFKTIRK